ncbi:HAL/PAL/TAL family ammonia-lyase [Oceanimonas baumannii]|uniref:Histidine ammonia-lyase n=1 Tax=Oceanimonas baumannii TaxID=129578 RepID=A0A235CEV8_9GAMM|nr:histidine ammonia-lyase [Oceanimonas baumannii]OYD22894.1 histidine ammonia-lyase [Oceanimonas baumannii]TDW56284.1 histidine ammonia-lyase [Oceanimonas baumannii]
MNNQPSPVIIGQQTAEWRNVVQVARQGAHLSLSACAWERINLARRAVETFSDSGQPYYGINTGLGALCHVVLDRSQLQQLSWHTLMSHSCGIGEPLKREQVRAIICAAVINYSHGCSGVSPEVVEGLIRLLNEDIVPRVPAQGSVGYLSHMAHIGLALLGEGEVEFRGRVMPARQALDAIGMEAVILGPKDGLSLVNGTPAMTGLACLTLADATRLAFWADVIGAMSFEALRGQLDALSPAVIQRKTHRGVQQSSENLRRLLQDSQVLARSQGEHLQDALSLRSIPQVHGACRDQLTHAVGQVNAELNSATDNPMLIKEEGEYRVISQANPHGESVAMACDLLAIAVCEWSSISERRSFRLVTPQANKLPPFLTYGSGVKSGMMIAQYSASSLVADNKRLAQPAVTDNYLTSGLQEDHLSLGESSALKLDKALDNAFHVLAIEYLLAAQAFDLIEQPLFGCGTGLAWRQLRERVAFYEEEHSLHLDIRATYELLRDESSLAALCRLFPQLNA